MAFSHGEVCKRFIRGEYRTYTGSEVLGGNMSIREGWRGLMGVRLGEDEPSRLPTLMSYNTPIAVVIGDGVIAVNPNKYSVTTARHQHKIQAALRDNWYKQPPHEPTWRPSEGMGMYRNASDPSRGWTWDWAFEIWEREEPSISDERRAQLEAVIEAIDNSPVQLSIYYRKHVKEGIEDVLALRTVDRVYTTVKGVEDAIEWEEGAPERARIAALEESERKREEREQLRREAPLVPLEQLRKVTSRSGLAISGGHYQYSLPQQDEHGNWTPGEWTSVVEDTSMCHRGFHVTEKPERWGGNEPSNTVWYVEVRGYGGRQGDKYVYQQIRLTRPDEDWPNEKRTYSYPF